MPRRVGRAVHTASSKEASNGSDRAGNARGNVEQLTLNLARPPTVSAAEIVDMWRQQRDRLAATLDELPRREWAFGTRCRSWSVADVVAHLADGARRMTSVLQARGEEETFRDIDPRTVPAEWIAGGERTPAVLLADYREWTDRLFDLGRALESLRSAFGVWAPYRRIIPWQLFMVHGLFDHWLHERDVLTQLGRAHHPTSADTRITAAYSVLIASIVAAMHDDLGPVHLHLAGPGGGCVRADGAHGEVTIVGPASCVQDPDGRARAVDVADALTGRTSTLDTHLTGPRDLVRSLGTLADWFRDGP